MSDRPEPEWSSLSHALGPAVDTPDHLAALQSTDPEIRQQGWYDLIGTANHQGDLYSVTPWIVSPLIDLAVDAHYPDRVEAAAYVTLIVEDFVYFLDEPMEVPSEVTAWTQTRQSERERWLGQCREVALSRAPEIVALAGDDDAEMRVWALRVTGVLVRAGAAPSGVLRRALTDSDSRARAIALWQLHISSPERDEVARSAAQIIAEAPPDRLDYFMGQVVSLAVERDDRQAAGEVIRMQDLVLPEFEQAALHHVAESPVVFAAALAGLGSVTELEALTR